MNVQILVYPEIGNMYYVTIVFDSNEIADECLDELIDKWIDENLQNVNFWEHVD